MPNPTSRQIELRGVRVHNLQNLDLDLPLGQLIVITGVSGAGKSSLAFDTLYAEGQRRYIESFSTYNRRFLECFEKPEADRIEPIPPAIAVRQRPGTGSRRATVGTATEIHDGLRVLFARLGSVVCPDCQRPVQAQSPSSVRLLLQNLPAGCRFQIGFRAGDFAGVPEADWPASAANVGGWLQAAGFTRIIVKGKTHSLTDTADLPPERIQPDAIVVVDRLTAGRSDERLADSLELAFAHGGGSMVALVEPIAPPAAGDDRRPPASTLTVDGRGFEVHDYSTQLRCPGCRREFLAPEPALFSFNSPRGACPECRGTGELASGPGVRRGTRDTCPACQGGRLQPLAIAVRLGGRNIVDCARLSPRELRQFLDEVEASLSDTERRPVEPVLRQIAARLEVLEEVGLGYLTGDRPLHTLSTGEGQRVRLTAALGASLVDMLYVLDEPTTGLHARDTAQLLQAISRLKQRGNSVIVVEHDAAVIVAADQVIDLGPGAGRAGGRLVYQGPPAGLTSATDSVTARCLAAAGAAAAAAKRNPTGWLRLAGIEHHNLHNVSVEIPLGTLCVVSGVSGSGKSSLITETLYPAVATGLARRKSGSANRPESVQPAHDETPGRYASLHGLEQIDAALLIDQTLLGRSRTANPATSLQLFAEIRALFAETSEAKVKNLTAAHFSFQTASGGRCETCQGTGTIAVDLQFLPDVTMTCPDCHGRRYRPEVLEVRYRGLSIAEVLDLTIDEAFSFFRGRHRLQRRLKLVRDLGLEYVRLGQPLWTLSGGEAQRLKLAAQLMRATRTRTLFVIDEPTAGLHPADITRLLSTLQQLVDSGHSLVIIEHDLQLLRAADYLIDLGPGGGEAGGQIVATGSPSEVAKIATSVTGRLLTGTSSM